MWYHLQARAQHKKGLVAAVTEKSIIFKRIMVDLVSIASINSIMFTTFLSIFF
jgi:hypothetical protein